MRLTLFVVLSLVGMFPAPLRAQTVPTGTPAAVVTIAGEIDDFQAAQLRKNVDAARGAGAKVVIVRINTYGGLVTSGLDISSYLKRQTDLHTIAFVDEKAISAGAMIAMACDEIVMDPSSTIGDCAPITFRVDGTLEAMPAAERGKAESPVLADFDDSAIRNHHDVLLAESMVAVGRVVHYVESPTGERRFVGPDDYAKLTSKDAGWKPVTDVPDPLDTDATLLTVHSELAKRIGLAAGISASPQTLATERNYAIVGEFAPGFGEAFIQVVGHPLTRLLLIVIFVASLKIALATPGHGAPEAVALFSFLLLVGIPLLTGYAQWWELVVIIAGLGLIAFEIFVLPGHFVGGALGVIMLAGGLILTFVGKDPGGPGFLPRTPGGWEALGRGVLVTTGGLLGATIVWVWLGRLLPTMPYFNKLVLSNGGTAASAVEQPAWPVLGAEGVAMSDLKPAGTARFLDFTNDEHRNTPVATAGEFVASGSSVIVTQLAGGRVQVRKT